MTKEEILSSKSDNRYAIPNNLTHTAIIEAMQEYSDSQNASLIEKVKALEGERDFYKGEYSSLKRTIDDKD